MNPLAIIALIAAGYYGWKNRSKLLAKFHTHESTQEWLKKQTPEDQALYQQMMTSGAFAVGQLGYFPPGYDPSQGYYDPSQGYYDPSQWGYSDPSQGGYLDPTQAYGAMQPQYGATYGDNQLPYGPGTCPPGQYWNLSQQTCLPVIDRRARARQAQQGRGGRGAQGSSYPPSRDPQSR